MMIGIRELTRNSNILSEHDYVDVEDKKTHEYKGVFVSAVHADMVKAVIDKHNLNKKKKALDNVMQFAGIADGDSGDKNAKEIRIIHGGKYSNS